MRASRWLVAALFVASTVVFVEAQQPRQPGGGGLGITNQVLTNTALQEDLKITDAQKEKLKVAADKAAALSAKQKDAFKGADKEKFKEIFSEFQKESAAVREANAKIIEETLTADQKARIKQIERQVAGVRAFSQDEVVADLKLNDTQKTKIKGIVEEYNKDARELGGFGGGKGGFDKEKAAEAQKKREKLAKGAMADIDEVLNDEQRKTWKDLTGAAFDRTKLDFGGGFGGFGTGGFGNKGKGPVKKD
jgi:hypothetical protein